MVRSKADAASAVAAVGPLSHLAPVAAEIASAASASSSSHASAPAPAPTSTSASTTTSETGKADEGEAAEGKADEPSANTSPSSPSPAAAIQAPQPPMPPRKPLVGHLALLASGRGGCVCDALHRILIAHGNIVKLDIVERKAIVIGSASAIQRVFLTHTELYPKGATLDELRAVGIGGKGIVETEGAIWERQHRLVRPAFRSSIIAKLADSFLDIAQRGANLLSEGTEFEGLALFSRVGFTAVVNTLFNQPTPVLDSLDGNDTVMKTTHYVGGELMKRMQRTRFWRKLPIPSNFKVRRLVNEMRELYSKQIEIQRKDPLGALLYEMLTYRDENGQPLPEDEILDTYQNILGAGHESTGNTLHWALYILCTHPEIAAKLQADILTAFDEKGQLNLDKLRNLKYLALFLKELLRVYTPFPVLLREVAQDDILDGFRVKKGYWVFVHTMRMHTDPAVWGNDAHLFVPERFSDERMASINPNAYLPFSVGPRACLGHYFFTLEFKIVLAVFLQRFHFSLLPNQEVLPMLKFALLSKNGIWFKAHENDPAASAAARAAAAAAQAAKAASAPVERSPDTPVLATTTSLSLLLSDSRNTVMKSIDAKKAPTAAHNTPLTIVYASQMGTSETYALWLSPLAKAQGYDVEIMSFADLPPVLSKKSLIVFVCPSYNGFPCEKMKSFYEYMQTVASSSEKPEFTGLFAGFGCGNKLWKNTFQAIPRAVDAFFESIGGERVSPLGEGDADKDLDLDFEKWSALLWPALALRLDLNLADATQESAPSQSTYAFEVSNAAHPADQSNPDSVLFTVAESRNLFQAAPGVHVNRDRLVSHLVLTTDRPVQYQAGDYFCVTPPSNPAVVEALCARLGVSPSTLLTMKPLFSGVTAVYQGAKPLSTVLSRYFDCTSKPTCKFFRSMAAHATDADEKAALQILALLLLPENASPVAATLARRMPSTYLEALQLFPSVKPSLQDFMQSVALTTPRYYSIASAFAPNKIELGVGAVQYVEAASGTLVHGLSSSWLCSLPVGSVIEGSIKQGDSSFRMPSSHRAPMLLVAAGTGITPMRSFLLQRELDAKDQQDSDAPEPAMLFFGCRTLGDVYFDADFRRLQDQGALVLHTAISRPSADDKSPKQHVQDKMEAEAESVWQLLQKPNSHMYVCGMPAMGAAVRNTLVKIASERLGSAEAGNAFVQELERSARYCQEVWGTDAMASPST
ncbi:hypothetical protein CAOG_07021 [Capsaspora owczarzaki ATCC 30864]|nr:hypothetical protein CAOG_07021 [Capsaspora owczarzaki ATCC 30864]|eukprot:XP_004343745.2 hypothetical protein CAOG_07021 [Capsaspora owczarzaki ATCC 30864]